MTSSFTYMLVILTLDGVTSFLQLMDIQSVLSKMADGLFIDSEGIVHIFNLLVLKSK